MNDCTIQMDWSPDFYPPTHNHPELFETFSRSVGDLVSDEGKLQDVEPTMGAEDFGFLSRTIPSTFFLLGQGGGGSSTSDSNNNTTKKTTIETNYGLHDPRFTLDEKNMAKGVELHVNIALRALKMLANKKETSL
jgi:metal-dependent amidase/aminoacylase/carboxypeptidase family protein